MVLSMVWVQEQQLSKYVLRISHNPPCTVPVQEKSHFSARAKRALTSYKLRKEKTNQEVFEKQNDVMPTSCQGIGTNRLAPRITNRDLTGKRLATCPSRSFPTRIMFGSGLVSPTPLPYYY